MFCSKSELNTNERGDFPSSLKVLATLHKARGRLEGELFHRYDLRCSCSRTQRIREPQGKMTEASEMLPQEESQSHLWVHKRQSKRFTDHEGRIRTERGPINFIIQDEVRNLLVHCDPSMFPAGVPRETAATRGFTNRSSLQQTRKHAMLGLWEGQKSITGCPARN